MTIMNLSAQTLSLLSIEPSPTRGGLALTEASVAALSPVLTWEDGSSYRAWVAQWKREYAAVTESIRAHRRVIRAKKAQQATWPSESTFLLALDAAHCGIYRDIRTARMLLVLRRFGRDAARAAYAARHVTVAPVVVSDPVAA